jgi:hypothetical protein
MYAVHWEAISTEKISKVEKINAIFGVCFAQINLFFDVGKIMLD